ncbi:HDIG domain-containing metalloprotein [Spirochaeta isovalerica]|uniref:Putative nucleotidyltransferase with HDIG domain n=1 Tax=Spirochaeta isovalerica TaxID=150 RepID=A0A841RDJ9_9SPIO|nr:HDIG domain-containing metalloprotein [Spirochaeta isovalerica]MBB6481706.1 putative nucleotidyltransferase with HDIG domain [Spirochaeta isovalerica]
MTTTIPSREDALELFRKYNKSDALYKHALSVEAVMRYIAEKLGEDVERWGLVGLVHDIDYEMYPDQHCHKSTEIFNEAGWPEELSRAVASHGWGICSDVEPQSLMEKYLFTIDELTGLVNTTALVRPSKSVLDMTPKSVKKKWKDKRFAAGVDRSIIEKGAAILGLEISEVIDLTIMGMRTVADEIGLRGEA